MNRIMLAVACLSLGAPAGFAAEKELQSGPAVGKSVGVFNPLNVTGRSAGEKVCQV